MLDGPTTPPPAPERRIAAVFDGGVVGADGRCKKPGTEPSWPSETLMDRGLTVHGLAERGGCKRPE
jgi:hypothetical protein